MHSPHAEEWQEAIEDEKNSLIALGVFKTIKHSDVPRDHKVVGSKMVFKIKWNKKGEITRYKVCCRQENGSMDIPPMETSFSYQNTLQLP